MNTLLLPPRPRMIPASVRTSDELLIRDMKPGHGPLGPLASSVATGPPSLRDFTDYGPLPATPTSQTLAIPSGAHEGDLLLMHGKNGSGATLSTVPFGWTLDHAGGNGEFVYWALYNSATTGTTWGKTGTGTGWRFTCTAWAGATALESVLPLTGGSSTTVTWQSVTTTHNNTMLIAFVMNPLSGAGRIFTDPCPAGWTTLVNDRTATNHIFKMSLAYKIGPATAGAVGSVTGVVSGLTTCITFMTPIYG